MFSFFKFTYTNINTGEETVPKKMSKGTPANINVLSLEYTVCNIILIMALKVLYQSTPNYTSVKQRSYSTTIILCNQVRGRHVFNNATVTCTIH